MESVSPLCFVMFRQFLPTPSWTDEPVHAFSLCYKCPSIYKYFLAKVVASIEVNLHSKSNMCSVQQ